MFSKNKKSKTLTCFLDCERYQKSIEENKALTDKLEHQQEENTLGLTVRNQCELNYIILNVIDKGNEILIVALKAIPNTQGVLYEFSVDIFKAAASQYPQQIYEIYTSVDLLQEFCYIHDITGKPCSGYGSIAMKYLLKQLKLLGIQEVAGTLSPIDIDHRNRQLHFYKKFGFNILPDNRIRKTFKSHSN